MLCCVIGKCKGDSKLQRSLGNSLRKEDGTFMHMQKINIARWKPLNWVFALFTMALVVNAGRLIHSQMGAQGVHPGKPIPYTVILRETVYSPDGNASVAMDETFAVRSDGSYVKKLTHKKQMGNNLVDADSERTVFFASDTGAQTRVHINDIDNTKSTEAAKINSASLQRDPSSKCINSLAGTPMSTRSRPEAISGEETVAGYRAVKITSNGWTWWFALDHGCAPVKVRVDWGSQGYSEKNLIALIPGEPTSALFNAPADDREMPPSERALGRGKKPSDCGSPRCAEILRMRDESYRANRPKK